MDLRKNLAALSRTQLEELFDSWEQPRFRVKQLLRWIWREGVTSLDEMTNLSRQLRDRLKAEYRIVLPQVVYSQRSEDGTVKHLLRLEDGKTIETVWIPREDQDRVTVCVSSQVGCKMGCTFCLTAQQKVERNLLPGEIAGQLMVLADRKKITNVVLMGMGEPFDNYDHLLGALDLMTDPESGIGLGPRHITVSTSGLVPAIERFLRESRCRLAVSLNAPNDEIRNEIMPINRAYPLEKLLGVLKRAAHDKKTLLQGRNFSVTFEYILIKDINDRPEHAEELARQLRGIPCKINLLLYNENPHVPYERPTLDRVQTFRDILQLHHLRNFVRTSRGRDISAACGQLASEHKRAPKPEPASSLASARL